MMNDERRDRANRLAQSLQVIQSAHDLLGEGLAKLKREHADLLDEADLDAEEAE